MQESITKRSRENILYDIYIGGDLADNEAAVTIKAITVDENTDVALTFDVAGSWVINTGAVTYNTGTPEEWTAKIGSVLQGHIGAGFDGTSYKMRIEYTTNVNPAPTYNREATFDVVVQDE